MTTDYDALMAELDNICECVHYPKIGCPQCRAQDVITDLRGKVTKLKTANMLGAGAIKTHEKNIAILTTRAEAAEKALDRNLEQQRHGDATLVEHLTNADWDMSAQAPQAITDLREEVAVQREIAAGCIEMANTAQDRANAAYEDAAEMARNYYSGDMEGLPEHIVCKSIAAAIRARIKT